MPKNIGNNAVANLDRIVSMDLATFSEPTGDRLTVIEAEQDIPFPIARLFYIYGCQSDCERGEHAHREAEQAFIAISGQFSLDVTNGGGKMTFVLGQPNRAIYVPAMIWTRVYGFSPDAVCLVLTNLPYDTRDYIQDWEEYISAVGKMS
jgi:hypothetical protein